MLTVLGHQQAQCWLKSMTCFLIFLMYFPGLSVMANHHGSNDVIQDGWPDPSKFCFSTLPVLTHWSLNMHICINKLNHHWFWQWLVACSASNHYPNQCWYIVNWALKNNLQWNSCRGSNIFIQKHGFESVICKMSSILSWPPCVERKAEI